MSIIDTCKMPADYQSTAQALALPTNDPRLSSEEDGHLPAWTRPSNPIRARSSSYGEGPTTFGRRMMRSADKFQRRALKTYDKLTILQKLLLFFAGITTIVFGILFLVYNKRVFARLLPLAEKWRNMRGGWLIIWALAFTVSFPPLIGYSTIVTVAGFLYGLPGYAIMPTPGFVTTHVLTNFQMVHYSNSHGSGIGSIVCTISHHSFRICSTHYAKRQAVRCFIARPET